MPYNLHVDIVVLVLLVLPDECLVRLDLLCHLGRFLVQEHQIHVVGDGFLLELGVDGL